MKAKLLSFLQKSPQFIIPIYWAPRMDTLNLQTPCIYEIIRQEKSWHPVRQAGRLALIVLFRIRKIGAQNNELLRFIQ
jgi:hypothetical protein